MNASKPALLLCAAMVSLAGSVAYAEEAPLAKFGMLNRLVGSCWQGSYGKTEDKQCYSSQFGRFLRGTIDLQTSAEDGRRQGYRGDSLFAWNAKQNCIDWFYWSDVGATGAVQATVDGDTVTFLDPPSPKTPEVRTKSVWRMLDADHYEVVRLQGKDAEWKETLRVVYRRETAAQ